MKQDGSQGTKWLPVSGGIESNILMSPETWNLFLLNLSITRFGWHKSDHFDATRNGELRDWLKNITRFGWH